PYGSAYTYAAAGAYPDMYVYFPSYGWRWVVAPWVWGIGPRPYFGVYGWARYGWYGRGFGPLDGFRRGGPGWARPGVGPPRLVQPGARCGPPGRRGPPRTTDGRSAARRRHDPARPASHVRAARPRRPARSRRALRAAPRGSRGRLRAALVQLGRPE